MCSSSYGGLAGPDKQHPAADHFATGLNSLLHIHGTLFVAADILLDFIQGHQGERKLSVSAQRRPDRFDHFIHADIRHRTILVVYGNIAGGRRII